MKKFISTLLLTMLLVLSAQPAFASEQQEIEYLDDGSYYITTIEDESPTSIIPYAATKSTSRTKSVVFYNSAKKAMWYVKVSGTFKYGNGAAVCTKSSVSAGSYVSAWKISNKSHSASRNQAFASATAKRYLDGSVVQTKTKTVSLTCSPTGKCS